MHPVLQFKFNYPYSNPAIILAHSPPASDVPPQQGITRQLKDTGELLGIRLLDLIIVDTDSGASNSFVEIGLL